MRNISRNEYRRKKDKTLLNSHTLGTFLFVFILCFGFMLGVILPLRPTESQIENRKLTEFPKFTVESALDGSFFSEVSLWYADSFPLRDFWMSGSDKLKSLYGYGNNQVVITNNVNRGDDIPTAPVKTPEEEPDGTVPAQTEAVPETVDEQGTDQADQDLTEEAEIPTVEIPDVINGQTIGAITSYNDTAYEMYFFNLAAANKYGEILNHVASEMAGQAKVYNIIVPLIEAYFLTDEIRVSLEPDWKNEEQALNYYASLFDPGVFNVPVYQSLLEHRDEYIFFRTDHHWTALGAYYAYRAWAEMKGVEPFPLDHFTRMEFPNFLGSLYRTFKGEGGTTATAMEQHPDVVEAYKPTTTNHMTFTESSGNTLNWNIVNDVSGSPEGQKYYAFCAGDNPFSYVENPNVDNGEVCIILKDSYANCFIPFLVDHYQYIYWFDYRSYNDNVLKFAKEHNVTDILFINGISPISDVPLMDRLSSLVQ